MKTLASLVISFFTLMTFSIAMAEGDPSNDKTANKNKVPKFEIENFKEDCVKDLTKESVSIGDFGDYLSVGPTVAAQAFNYDLASKRTSFNAGAGAGLAFRIYWPPVSFAGDTQSNIQPKTYGIKSIRKKCRVESFDPDLFERDTQKVAPLFSISPMLFASKSERGDDIRVQPVISIGFLGELVNVGAGFNLSGPDKGHVFILLSLGYGFKF